MESYVSELWVVRMYLVYSKTEFKPGTDLARVYMYDEDGDVIMTIEPVYEDDFYDSESECEAPGDD